MIKLANSIPELTDPSDPSQLQNFCTAVKLAIDELAQKASSSQMEIRTTAPTTNDIEEGEMVRATVGGLNYIYTKKDGTILRWQIT